jgi:hypothetical protein
MRRIIRLLPTIGLVLSAVLSPAVMLAQASVLAGHRQPVTVALVDSLPTLREQFAAAVVRSPGKGGHDVILLPSATATGDLLDQATRVLLDARVRQGDHPATIHGKSFNRLLIGVRGKPSSASWAQSDISKAQIVVDKLRNAHIREIPGIGKAPALDFLPPPIRRAVKSRASGE